MLSCRLAVRPVVHARSQEACEVPDAALDGGNLDEVCAQGALDKLEDRLGS
jgi:hypothetical protein